MVEKWLLQVQVTMIQSLKDVTEHSVDAYTTTPREKWVLSWPGQVSPTRSGLVLVLPASTTFPKLPGARGLRVLLKEVTSGSFLGWAGFLLQ